VTLPDAVPPDLISFGAALDTLARPAAWRQAVALLNEAQVSPA